MTTKTTKAEDRWTIEARMAGKNLAPPRVSGKGLVLPIQQAFVLRGRETAWIDMGVALSAICIIRGEPFAAVTPGLFVQPDVLLPGEPVRVAISNATEFVQTVPAGMGLVIAEPQGWPWLRERDVDVRVVVA